MNDPQLGQLNWPTNLHGNVLIHLARIAALAFFDNTSWIVCFRNSLQDTINISDEFFYLNVIDINGDKSEVITINADHNRQPDDGVIMGKNRTNVKPFANNQLTRYLGVWFSSKLSLRH